MAIDKKLRCDKIAYTCCQMFVRIFKFCFFIRQLQDVENACSFICAFLFLSIFMGSLNGMCEFTENEHSNIQLCMPIAMHSTNCMQSTRQKNLLLAHITSINFKYLFLYSFYSAPPLIILLLNLFPSSSCTFFIRSKTLTSYACYVNKSCRFLSFPCPFSATSHGMCYPMQMLQVLNVIEQNLLAIFQFFTLTLSSASEWMKRASYTYYYTICCSLNSKSTETLVSH